MKISLNKVYLWLIEVLHVFSSCFRLHKDVSGKYIATRGCILTLGYDAQGEGKSNWEWICRTGLELSSFRGVSVFIFRTQQTMGRYLANIANFWISKWSWTGKSIISIPILLSQARGLYMDCWLRHYTENIMNYVYYVLHRVIKISDPPPSRAVMTSSYEKLGNAFSNTTY